MNYLFDVFLISLPLLTAYGTILFFLHISLYLINRQRILQSKSTFTTKGQRKILVLPVILILFLSATSSTVTWKNSLDTTDNSIREIRSYNRERSISPIVDTSKQPGANSEALRRELEKETQSWKNKPESEKID